MARLKNMVSYLFNRPENGSLFFDTKNALRIADTDFKCKQVTLHKW